MGSALLVTTNNARFFVILMYLLLQIVYLASRPHSLVLLLSVLKQKKRKLLIILLREICKAAFKCFLALQRHQFTKPKMRSTWRTNYSVSGWNRYVLTPVNSQPNLTDLRVSSAASIRWASILCVASETAGAFQLQAKNQSSTNDKLCLK